MGIIHEIFVAIAEATKCFTLTSKNLQVLIHSAGSHCQRNLAHHQYFQAHDFHATQRTRQWNCEKIGENL